MIPRMPNRQYAYFRDDQIVFLMTHTQDRLTETNVSDWKSAIEEPKPSLLHGATIHWPPRWSSFRNLADQEYQPSKQEGKGLKSAFSVLVCDMDNAPQDPLEFLDLISELSNPSAGLIGNAFAGLTTKDISPNWLASGASQSGGTGGPGGWPAPFRSNPSRAPYQFRELIDKLKGSAIYGDGDGLDVAILDTAPCPHDLVAAYKECKSWHPLIRTLLGPDGKLKLYPATYEENLRMGSTSLNEHDYKMTDHGLFVAGIVHSIVPKATIHLIEVLNPFGVGDLESLAAGLKKAYDEIFTRATLEEPEQPTSLLAVHCSWMLEPPLVAEQRRNPDSEFEEKVMEMAISYQEEDNVFALKSLCNLFADAGRPVIASAGNDGRKKIARIDAPATRYPAAFLRTYGVGALPKDSEPDLNGKYAASSYSNLADIPANVTRIMTLGGEEGEGQGVLGLYLGEFPGCEPQPNCTKWAWWAGTSFAAPILTGAIAAVLSSPENPAGPARPKTTEEAVDRLLTESIILPQKTDAGEAVMEAVQDC